MYSAVKIVEGMQKSAFSYCFPKINKLLLLQKVLKTKNSKRLRFLKLNSKNRKLRTKQLVYRL